MVKKPVGFNGLIAKLTAEYFFQEDDVREALGQLDKRQQQVLVWCYGLDNEALTLKEIAVRLNISHTSAGQIRKKAIRLLRRNFRQVMALNSSTCRNLHQELLEQKKQIEQLLHKAGFQVKNPFKPLAELGLSNRTVNRLKMTQVTTLFDLAICTEHDLSEIYGFGSKCLEEVRECLKRHDLDFLKFSPQ